MQGIIPQKRLITIYTTALLVSVSVFIGCKGGKDDPDQQYDRSLMLQNYAENLIEPGYLKLKQSVATLETGIQTFTSTPNVSNLNSVRDAWKTSLLDWQSVSVYEFGPAADVLLRDNVNLFPVDTVQIQSNISTGTYNLDAVSNYSAKGFQALDYLLFGLSDQDSAIVSLYSTDSEASNRKEYLKAVITDIKAKVDPVYNDWNTFYSDTFQVRNGVDVGSSTGLMVNALNKYFEVYLRDGKIGIPVGARSFSGTPLPEKTEAYYANDFSIQLCSTAVQALKNMYLGVGVNQSDGEGMEEYLIYEEAKSATGGDLNTEINAQFDVVLSKLNALNEPLSDEVVNNQATVQEVFDEMQQLAILLKVDMPAAFGTLITYSDSDGD